MFTERPDHFSGDKGRENELADMHFDGVIVLSGGCAKIGENYYPASYQHDDGNGMLGGDMRVLAAFELYKQKVANTFVFTTGRNPKDTRSNHHTEPPITADVYQRAFLCLVNGMQGNGLLPDLPPPITYTDCNSTTTYGDIVQGLLTIQSFNGSDIAILTSEYHIPRVWELYLQAQRSDQEKLREANGVIAVRNVLSAEQILITADQEKYRPRIERYYKTDLARKRNEMEQKGLRDLETGDYKLTI